MQGGHPRPSPDVSRSSPSYAGRVVAKRRLAQTRQACPSSKRIEKRESAPSALFLVFFLRDARLHQSLNKCSRQRLPRGEVDGPFGCREALEFVLERLDHGRAGEQTAVVRKRGEPHQHSLVLERRNPIADGLGSLRGHSGPNRRAHLVQHVAREFRDASKVFINAFRSAFAFRPRTALARFPLFHAGNTTKTFTPSLVLGVPPNPSTWKTLPHSQIQFYLPE